MWPSSIFRVHNKSNEWWMKMFQPSRYPIQSWVRCWEGGTRTIAANNDNSNYRRIIIISLMVWRWLFCWFRWLFLFVFGCRTNFTRSFCSQEIGSNWFFFFFLSLIIYRHLHLVSRAINCVNSSSPTHKKSGVIVVDALGVGTDRDWSAIGAYI